MNFKNILKFLFFTLLLNSCAQQGTLTGGAKDTKAPKIVEKKSTPNLQTNFRPKEIELTFDEWIKLEDVFNQVVISPPMTERPEVTLHNKTVRVVFPKDEPLKDNATYTINFGNSIKDYTEGNIPPNLRFVFSTGPVIDSLVFRGRVVDAVTGEPTEGALLMLYDNLADSVVRKNKPFYFSKTDKSGWAKIENVRPGTFKAFALMDKDVNYLFNQDVEKIGFPDSLVVVSAEKNSPADTLNQDSSKVLTIKLFDPKKKFQVITRETDRFGVAKVVFNQNANRISYKIEGIESYKTETSKDSLLVFYNNETPFSIITKMDTLTDTARVRPRGRADFFKRNNKLEAIGVVSNTQKNPVKPYILQFNNPILTIDSSKITLIDSAKKVVPLSWKADSISARKWELITDWKDGVKYNLSILPDALTDIYGFKNDTIQTAISVLNKKDFGDIVLTIMDLDTNKNYICQLLNATGVVERSFIVSKQSTYKTRLETLLPEQYTIKVIEDLNANGVWDTGDYDAKKQPERIFLRPLDQALRPNWELEATIEISETKK